MITIGTGLGIYTIDEGKLVTDNRKIKVIYDEFVKEEAFGPSDGPEDYAIAKKLADFLGEGFDIIAQDELEQEEIIY